MWSHVFFEHSVYISEETKDVNITNQQIVNLSVVVHEYFANYDLFYRNKNGLQVQVA